ncbi:hypothetical protein [Rufibacter roseolus]|uniref:hypothetical protein n=1 Tax=Rufibacter roseolus TaxID=2817375 RepID=UPI001B30BC92|nr:hypothetical protein [Rufibacter roseolus]
MPNLADIKDQFIGGRIPYAVLLGLKEWKSKREEIIRREHNTCEKCKTYCIEEWMPTFNGLVTIYQPVIWEEVEIELPITSTSGIEVDDTYTTITIQPVTQEDPHIAQIHHTYYLKNRHPWQYPNESLMLVCHKCHYEIHKEEVIKVYENADFGFYTNLTPCSKCLGTGYLPEYDYHKDGVCFECNGSRFTEWQ